MKTSGSMIGGALQSSMYAPFAGYFVKYLQAYSAAGINVDYISLQNEPLFVPGNYPGMCMPASSSGSCGAVAAPTDETAALRDYVLPALTAANLKTQVLVYDHNWDAPDYSETVLADPVVQASAQVAGSAWHGYGGTPGVMTTIQNNFPSKGSYETEHSGGTWIPDQVKSDFEEITQVMRNCQQRHRRHYLRHRVLHTWTFQQVCVAGSATHLFKQRGRTGERGVLESRRFEGSGGVQ